MFSTRNSFDFIPPDLPPTCHSGLGGFRSRILRLRTFCPEKVCPERLLDIFRTRLVGLGPFSGLFAQILKITGNYVGLGGTKMYQFEPASTWVREHNGFQANIFRRHVRKLLEKESLLQLEYGKCTIKIVS